MDARLDLIQFSICGFNIAIEDVRNQGQTSPRVIERDDGVGEEEDAVWDTAYCGLRIAYRVAVHSGLESWFKKSNGLVPQIAHHPADESRHARLRLDTCTWRKCR